MQRNTIKAAIIDYTMGNLFSVKRACAYAGMEAFVTGNKDDLKNVNAIILPGVGAFGDAMDNLKRLDLISPLKDYILSNKPFLGICLGMQLLMSQSEEFGSHNGFGIFEGSVKKLSSPTARTNVLKVPQVGWNRIFLPDQKPDNLWNGSILNGIHDGEFMYFVHSFHVVPDDKSIILSVSDYEGCKFISSIKKNNIFACQFHPEKSCKQGLALYMNFRQSVDNFLKEEVAING